MASPVSAVFFDLGDTLVVSSARDWVPGAKSLLATLRTRSVRIGVLSDTGALTRTQLAGLLPASFDWDVFDSELVLLSSETGIDKSDPAAFAQLNAAAGVPAGECLFVTENLGHTLVAQTLGVKVARIVNADWTEAGFVQLERWLEG